MWSFKVLFLVFGLNLSVSSTPSFESEPTINFGDDYINDEIPKFQHLTSSFDLGGLMTGNRMAGVPLGRSLGTGELDVEGVCSGPGFTCENCSHAVTCILLPVGWLKIPLQECTSGQYCNAHEGKCSETPVPECDPMGKDYKHTCEQVGIFPDAHDCRKFHLCSPAEGMMDDRPADHRMALCPRHYGYDPRIAQCSIKLHKGQCQQKPVPGCTTIGESAALPSSPNHYYVCVQRNEELHPQIFICPHGWFFIDGFCRPEPEKPVTPPMFEDRVEEGHIDDNAADRPDTNFVGKDEIIMERHDSNEDVNVFEHDNNHVYDKNHVGSESNEDSYHIQSHHHQTESDEHHDTTHVTDEKPAMTFIEAFFSTEKTSTYAADTFLADKFDLTNYETVDDAPPPSDVFVNSFESGVDFW